MRRSLFWLAAFAAGSATASEAPAAAIAPAMQQPGSRQSDHNRIAHPGVIEHVLVSVPLHRTEAETALPVTVLDSEQLRQQAGKSLGATLDGMPGLASASFGPGVGQPVIRGQAGPRVRVLQNGIASADAATVSADHAVAVEPLLADSVEVLRGPATLLYGGGAIGGVVNVIDSQIPRAMPEQALSGAIEQRHDSASDGDTSVFRLHGGAGAIAWHLEGVYRDWNPIDVPGLAFDRDTVTDLDESGHGHIGNSDGRNHRVSGGISWIFDRGHVGFGVSELRSKYGVPTGGHVHHGDDHGHDHDHGDHDHHDHDQDDDQDHLSHGGEDIRIDMSQRRYDLAGEWRDGSGLLESLRWRVAYTDYEHSELEGGVEATRYERETGEGRLELIHRSIAGWHGVLGLQVRDSDFSALGEEAFIPASNSRGAGLFLIEDYHHGDWLYEIGLRADRDEVEAKGQGERHFNAYSASASALWNMAGHWSLGAAFSHSQRAPTVEELYSNVESAERHGDHFHYHDPVVHAATRSIEVGDADLGRETARNLDLTLRYHGERIRGFVTGFYNDFEDFIHLANSGVEVGEVPVLLYRQEDARFHGVEFELTLPVAEGALGDLSLTLSGDRVRGELKQGGDVPRLPDWRAGARLDLQRGGLGAYVGLTHAGAQKRAGDNETASDAWDRLDAGVSYGLATGPATTTLFLRAVNLTDEEIRLSTSFLRDYAPEPGRSLEAGIRLVF